MRLAGLLIGLILLSTAAPVLAQPAEGPGAAVDLSPKDRLELEAYRKAVPALARELQDLRTRGRSDWPEARQAYGTYLARYYQQANELQDIRIRIYSWQITAGNWVLALVVFVSVSGVLFAGYQLFVSVKLGREISATTIDVSAQRVQVTSATVGIIVLVISGVFLLLFLNEVYRIRPVDSPAAAERSMTDDGS